jgi:hypothetical protein
MADPRDRQQDEAQVLQGLIDQDTAPVHPDEPETDQVTENADGSATLTAKEGKKRSGKFYRNLATELDPLELERISTTLLKLIEDDKKARAERDKQYEEGLKRMGLSKETIGGANFIGSSIVAHPMFTQACIDFEARAIKELLPANGPAREFVPGTITTEKTDRARRKAKWFNYLVLNKMPGFSNDLEQLLIQLPMSGDQYIKLLPPTDKFRVTHEWVPCDEMLLPEAASSFEAAERRTHVQRLTAQMFGARIQNGFYRDVPAVAPSLQDEESRTDTAQAAAKIEGKEDTGQNIDGVRLVYECDCLFQIPVDDNPAMASEVEGMPYLISLEPHTREVLAVYRNWAEDDEDGQRLDWAVDFGFIPFRGAYHIGFPHIIGGLAIAATGALRALMDAAHISNLPGLLKLKGAAGTAQSITVSPTSVNEIEGTTEVDDIRKLIMTVPFKEPSAVLFQLLGFLDTKGQEVVRTTLDESNDNANMPVGTQMMRIEQGMIVFSAIHRRLHQAMDKFLKILHRLCGTYLEDQDVIRELGEPLVTRADFEGPSDVLPASDPNIFCELQRYAQVQTVAQRALLLPQVYDLRKVEELILKQMRLPNDGKDLLVPKPEPTQLNPVNENVALAMGRPIVAFPEQDHDAHIQAHCGFLQNPMFTMVVGQTPQQSAALMQHLKEHVSFWYAMQVHQVASETATQVARAMDTKAGPVDIGTLPQSSADDPQVGRFYDRMLVKASARVMQQATDEPVIKLAVLTMQKLQQALQAMQPPPPMDPAQAAAAETQRKAAADKADQQLRGQELQQQGQESQADNTARLQQTALQTQGQLQKQTMADDTKLQVTTQDNVVAQNIATEKAITGASTNIKDGTAVGKKGPGE